MTAERGICREGIAAEGDDCREISAERKICRGLMLNCRWDLDTKGRIYAEEYLNEIYRHR
jgi:hypothetical protein